MAGYDDQTKRIGDGGWPPAGRPASTPQINVARLWSGGVATAVVAALIGLVGLLIVRVLLQTVPGAANAAEFNDSGAIFICSTAAVAALVATGLVHLLLGTPRPLAYFGWIVGLLTAIAVVVPFLSSRQILTSVALAVIHLVIGIAIGSLVTGAAAAATRRPPVRSGYDQGWDDRRY